MKSYKSYWRTDERISADQLRVIGADGKQLGVLSKSVALEKARKSKLTLVEIAPNAKPPVAKIVDFGKFRYQEEKKARKESKGAKGGQVKEVRFSPFIADNDFSIRIEKIKEFLAEKNKVRMVVVFTGPQMRVRQVGYKVIGRVLEILGESVVTDMQPKFLGKHLITIISPTNKKIITLNEKTKV